MPYLGTSEADDLRVALVLGLFDGRDATAELRALRGILPDATDEIVCLTPMFSPTPDIERALSAIRVRVAQLSTFDPRTSLRDLLRPPARTVPLVTLSANQEQEALVAGFVCSWPIVVTGRRARGGTTVVEISGAERHLGRTAFPLFMRLVAGLTETANGYLPKGRLRGGGGLAGEGYYTADGMEGAIGRLREALGPEFKSLIEVRGGMVRLSAHPRYLRFEGEALAEHPDVRVQDLAARIAAAGEQ